MPTPELSRAKVVRRLMAEGWINEGGGKHDLFRHPGRGVVFAIPRHRLLSPGVARALARVAGW
jgi:predicted RNA binding protein YcfA (HicA-like mRNA interferase family)